MTNKDAIAMLKRIQEPEPFEPQINEAAFEALQMAIEALEGKDINVPTTDLISRQVAIFALKKQRGVRPTWDLAGLSLAINVLNELPPAQVKVEACDRPCTEDDYWYCNDCDHMEVCRYYPMKGCEYKSQPSAQQAKEHTCDNCLYSLRGWDDEPCDSCVMPDELKHWKLATQPDRSLRFRIGEICVDESKGFISSGRAVEKIRELLREAEGGKNERSDRQSGGD